MAEQCFTKTTGPSSEGLSDDVIMTLARQVPHGKYHDLGVKLGLSWNEADNILQKNLQDYTRASSEILMTWKTAHGSQPAHKDELCGILKSAELGDLPAKRRKLSPRDETVRSPEKRLTLDNCRKILREQYRKQKLQLNPWDKDAFAEFPELHTDISLYQNDKGKWGLEPTKVPVNGSINGIFKIEINGKLPRRLLLVGRAGHGKTTAINKLAYDWATNASDSALREVSLLFVLRFRKSDRETSLEQAIKSQLLSSQANVTPEEIEHLISENQDKCVLLLDGYDEFSGSIVTDKSSLVQLIRGERFPECRVLISSRPHRKEDFEKAELPRNLTVMEIEGYSREDAEEYINRFFSDQMKCKKLKEVAENHNIGFLIKIPFFCMVLCVLFKTGFLKGSFTLTAVITSLFKYLCLHALEKNPLADQRYEEIFKKEFQEKSPDRKRIEQIWGDTFDRSVKAIGKVALEYVRRDSQKLLFNSNDFASCPTEMRFAINVGVISEESFTVVDSGELNMLSKVTIEFFHKLAQEFCAGVHLSSLIKENEHVILGLIHDSAGVLELENVLRFAVGSCDQSFYPIIRHICSLGWRSGDYEHHRLLLELFGELSLGDQVHIPDEKEVAKELHRHLSEGEFHVDRANANTIQGLERLPEESKAQIHRITINDTKLDEQLSERLWSCLRSLPSLTLLDINNSCIPLPPSPPPLPSVRKLKAFLLPLETNLSGLIGSLSGLKEIDVLLRNAERDIEQTATGLRLARSGGGEVTRITLEGLSADSRTVSSSTMSRLGRVIEGTNRLQKIELRWLTIDEESLVSLVKSCRTVNTMQSITIWQCGVETKADWSHT